MLDCKHDVAIISFVEHLYKYNQGQKLMDKRQNLFESSIS